MVKDNTILLIKHTYLDGWYLPGGGVKRGETLEQAVRREAAEEVGGQLAHLELLGVYTSFWQAKSDHVIVFVSDNFILEADTHQAEIEQVDFFTFDDLPPDISPGSRRRIAEYVQNQTPFYGSW